MSKYFENILYKYVKVFSADLKIFILSFYVFHTFNFEQDGLNPPLNLINLYSD